MTMTAWSDTNMPRPPPMSITVTTTAAPASRPRPVAMSIKRTQPATRAPRTQDLYVRSMRLRDGYYWNLRSYRGRLRGGKPPRQSKLGAVTSRLPSSGFANDLPQALINFQACGGVLFKGSDRLNVVTKQFFDRFGRLVATPQPDYFGRRSSEDRSFRKIGVKRDERKAIFARIVPNLWIARFCEPHKPDLIEIRKKICEPLAKFEA